MTGAEKRKDFFNKLIGDFEVKYKISFDGVQTNIVERWENGIPHNPKSIEIVKAMELLDFVHGSDYLCIKTGGDGDNGEHMLYLLDIYFEAKERQELKVYNRQL